MCQFLKILHRVVKAIIPIAVVIIRLYICLVRPENKYPDQLDKMRYIGCAEARSASYIAERNQWKSMGSDSNTATLNSIIHLK